MTRNKLRLIRELVDRLPKRTDEQGPGMVQDPPDEYYRKSAADILRRLDLSGEVSDVTIRGRTCAHPTQLTLSKSHRARSICFRSLPISLQSFLALGAVYFLYGDLITANAAPKRMLFLIAV